MVNSQKTSGLNGLLGFLWLIAFMSAGISPAIAAPGGMPSYAGFSRIDPVKTSFIIVGDTREASAWEFWRDRNPEPRLEITAEIARRDPAFVINLGDLVMTGSSAKDWRDFDGLGKTLRGEGIPYFPILGNHEIHGDDKTALDNYFGRFPDIDHRRWYSFTWKGIGFIMLDSNFADLDKQQNALQERWYLSELERFDRDRTIDYVIVCCHKPPFTNGEVEAPNAEVEARFAGPFLRFRKTCLFFSGHAHTYERFERGGKFFIVSGGGGAPRHRVVTDPEKRRYKDSFSGPALRFFHFCQLEVEPGVLSFEVVRLDNDGGFSVVDPLKIRRLPQ